MKKRRRKKTPIILKALKKLMDNYAGTVIAILIAISIVGITFMPKQADAEDQTIHIIIEQHYQAGCITVYGNLCETAANQNGGTGSSGGSNSPNVNIGNALSNSLNNSSNQSVNEEHHNENPYDNHKNPWPEKPNPYINHHIPMPGEDLNHGHEK